MAADPSDLPEILAFAAQRARECRAFSLKIEPGWSAELVDRGILKTGRYVPAKRELPGSTLIIDLPDDPEVHFRTLPEEARFGLQQARRLGVGVEMLSPNNVEKEGIEEFLDLLEDTSKRQGFVFGPRAFYRHLVMSLPTQLMLARQGRRLVAGALIAAFHDVAYYLYGAFTAEEADLRALDLVQWEVMDSARLIGCSRYDMWGMPYRPYPNFWAWGYDPSKTRLEGTPVEYTGAYRQILSHLELWENSTIGYAIGGYRAFRKAVEKTPVSMQMKSLKRRLIDQGRKP